MSRNLLSLGVSLLAWPASAAFAVVRTAPVQGPELSSSALEARGPSDVPSELCPEDWSSIRAAWEAGRHAVLPADDGWRARNPGQGWVTSFDGRGVRVRPDSGGWEWGLELVRWGFAGAERCVEEPLAVSAKGQRVAYRWDETLDEWYVNDARGLEHGFTVRERPALGDDAGSRLSFTLAVRGELRAEVEADGRGARFLGADGAPALLYTGLTVLDADGNELVAGIERAGDGLRLWVDERGARYPLTIDPVAQLAYLKASNSDSGDLFGWSVAISGDTVVVGAPEEDSSASGVNGDQANDAALDSGAVYVFVGSGTSWSQEAYLKASNTQSVDRFGTSVSISGNCLVVGAPGEDSHVTGVNGDQTSNGASASGAAYVFLRSGNSWVQEAYLKASNTGGGDAFGESVAVSEDVVVVGASDEDSASGILPFDNSLPASGAAYVFERGGSGWSPVAYLKASNPDTGDSFGRSVAVSGDTAVVGAPEEDSNSTGINGNQGNDDATDSGAAYVFARGASGWSQTTYLKASNTDSGDSFGQSVSLSGDVAVVGANKEDSAATGVNGDPSNDDANDAGAAYVFARSAGTWAQEAYLKASSIGPRDEFGFSVSVSADHVLVGAHLEGPVLQSAGAAYAFARSGTDWSEQAFLKASNAQLTDAFGWSVALSGKLAVVGAHGEDSNANNVNGNQAGNSAPSAGAAYVFELAPQASVLFRNAGSNPASYAASPVTVGSSFTATVDNNLAAQASSLLFAFEAATSFPLAGGQVLLCIDQGSGELFTGLNLAPLSSAGGVDSYSLAVPSNPALAGAAFSSQAIQFGHPPFVLSNAQDLTVGGF